MDRVDDRVEWSFPHRPDDEAQMGIGCMDFCDYTIYKANQQTNEQTNGEGKKKKKK